jgi:hypothetical protein
MRGSRPFSSLLIEINASPGKGVQDIQMIAAVLKRLVLPAIALMLAACAHAEETTEMPAFTVIAADGAAEIRAYAPMIVAEVTVEAPSVADAANAGFRPLANYIFGGNAPRQKIAMTSPVTAAPKGQKIAMTAPVTAAESSAAGSYVVRFIMPAEWTMDTLPAPANPDVRLVPVPGRTLAAYRYTGSDSEKKREKAEAALRAFARAGGYTVTGEPEWAGYDAPFVPFFLRRYEIMLPVEPANKE